MFNKNPSPKGSPVTAPNDEIDWELRPGGMLVQRREDGDEDKNTAAAVAARGPIITIHISHGQAHHVINLLAHSSFGELKGLLLQKTGLEPEQQKLLFRGKEKDDEEYLDVAGVKDNSRVILLEKPKSKEASVDENNEMVSDAGEAGVERDEMAVDAREIGAMTPEMAKAFEAIAGVRAEVDSLSDRVSALDVAVNGGTKVSDKEFAVTTELLMRQLLKLDGINAEGEARLQRKAEVCRVQNLVDTLDTLKERNSNPVNNNGGGITSQDSNGVTSSNCNSATSQNANAVSVTTKWETFDSGVGSLSAPAQTPSSQEVTQDWEKFD